MSKTFEGLTGKEEEQTETKREVTVPEQQLPAVDMTESDIANLRKAAAGGVRTSFLRATRLKYVKGQWFMGQDKREIENGTRFTALISEFRHGWERWENQKPIPA